MSQAPSGVGAVAGAPGGEDTICARRLWAFLAAVTAVRGLYLMSGELDLSPDEAHYWEWSRRLDLSYYSKGPLVAYLIFGLSATLGDSVLAIRTGALILSIVGSLVTYRLGRDAFGRPAAGLLAATGLQLTPLVWAGSLLLTIDPPFLVAWLAALLWLHRALVQGRSRAWLPAGAAMGLGLLAKYAMLFILPGLVLYLWRAPRARAWLRRREPYLGTGVAMALFLPVIVWNARRGWVSARHVASQGRGTEWSLLTLVEFLGSQLGVLSPLVGLILAWAAWWTIREGLIRGREPYRFLGAFASPVLAFYLVLSLQGKVQANWPAAAYPPLALAAAGALLERRSTRGRTAVRRQARLLVAAMGLAVAIVAAGHVTDRLGIPPRLDPTARLRGWQQLGDQVSAHRAAMPAPERTFLVSDRYQIASELAYYVEGHPPTYNVNLGRRLNQYDFWDGPETRLGWDAIYVHEGLGALDDRLVAAFDRVDGPSVLEVRRRGQVARVFALYRGYAFRGVAAPTGPVGY